MLNCNALLMFSGGIDSTFVAYEYLRNNPDKNLFIHHIDLRNVENRSYCENRSVIKILNYFREHGLNNFHYTNSVFDYGMIQNMIYDIEITAFMTYVILRRNSNKNLDTILFPFYMNKSNDRYKLADNIIKLLNKPLNFKYPIKNMTKKQVMEGLPKDLLELTWYCRTPKNNSPCGSCITCQEVRSIN